MAKEYKRSSASSEKRTFGAKKRSTATQKNSSGRQKRDEEDDRPERKSGERKPFVKKAKKREEDSSFKRYRDDGKPSDFGSGKRASYSNDKSFSGEERPFKKRSASGDRSFNKGRSEDRERPSRSKSFSDDDRPFNKRAGSGDRSFNKDRSEDRERPSRSKSFSDEDRPHTKRSGSGERSFNKDRSEDRERPSRSKSFSDEDRPQTKRSGSGERSFNKDRSEDRERPSRSKSFSDEDRPQTKRSGSGERSFNKDRSEDRPFNKEKQAGSRSGEDRPFNKRSGQEGSFKSFRDKSFSPKKKKEANPYDLDESDFEFAEEEDSFDEAPVKKRDDNKRTGSRKATTSSGSKKEDGLIRLNKYISNAGICSRREADDLIASGVVQVNGKTITEMGYKVKPSDVIKYGGQTLKKERMVYLILNKPKDYITTVDDPQKRRTVLELVHDACKERIYPVGRLDRSTTGLLMFTNDGELTKKLTHPKYGVRKIYHVELDKPLKKQDLDQVTEGLELEDGFIKVDEISYVGDGKDKSQIGVELHSGKNRIVRRIFEHLGYNVRKLDRVMFGPLTKKDLPRGRWRFLTQSEVGIMNMISSD